MSELVAVTYPNLYRAAEVCAMFQRLQQAFLIDIEDAAYVTKELDGSVKLHLTIQLVGPALHAGMVKGTWGALIRLLFLQPLLGMAVGGPVGAANVIITGELIDYGIPDPFISELGQTFQAGTSTLFILFRRISLEKVLDRVAHYGGTVMHRSLSPKAEAKLQAALSQADPTKAA